MHVLKMQPSKTKNRCTLQIAMFATLTKLHLKTHSVFVHVAFLSLVLHQAPKEYEAKYKQSHTITVNYMAFCKADTEHLQINLFCAKSGKVGSGGEPYIYIYIYIVHI